MHQVMEYHEHSYLVSLLFAAPFLLFIIFSNFFSTCDKLNRNEVLTHLKGDGLMFYHVYADLMVLAKSNALKISALDMTYHYLELLTFLRELQQHPDTILDGTYQVFRSEKSLYGDDKRTNHRLHDDSKPVHKRYCNRMNGIRV